MWLFIKNNFRFLLILCNWILVRIHGLSNDLAPHPAFRTSWGTTTSSRRNPSKNWFNRITDSCITTTIRRVRIFLYKLNKNYFSKQKFISRECSNYELNLTLTLIIIYSVPLCFLKSQTRVSEPLLKNDLPKLYFNLNVSLFSMIP